MRNNWMQRSGSFPLCKGVQVRSLMVVLQITIYYIDVDVWRTLQGIIINNMVMFPIIMASLSTRLSCLQVNLAKFIISTFLKRCTEANGCGIKPRHRTYLWLQTTLVRMWDGMCGQRKYELIIIGARWENIQKGERSNQKNLFCWGYLLFLLWSPVSSVHYKLPNIYFIRTLAPARLVSNY